MPNPFASIGAKLLEAVIAALIPVLLKLFKDWLDDLASKPDEFEAILGPAVANAVAKAIGDDGTIIT